MSLENRDWSIHLKDSKVMFTTRLVQFNPHNKNDWLEMLNIKNGDTVLEVGCGAGAFCQRIKEFLPKCKVFGVDANEEHVTFAKQSAKKVGTGVTFELGDVNKLPFEDEKFDVVFSHDIINDYAVAHFFSEQHRVLKKGGKLVVMISEGRHHINNLVIEPESREERLWQKLAKQNSNVVSSEGLHNLSLCDTIQAVKRNGFINPQFYVKNILWYCPDDSRFDQKFAKQMIFAYKNFDIETLKMIQGKCMGLSANEFHELETFITDRYEKRILYLEEGRKCWDYATLCVKAIVAEKAEENIYDR